MRRRVAVVLAGALVALAGSLPVGALVGVEVIGTRADELNPAATADHLSWDVWDGTRVIVYAKPTAGPRFRVSPTGWSGANGSIEGTALVYQQYSHDRGVSDIYEFDLDTKTRSKIGPPVSTSRWEYGPSRSGDVTAFARVYRNDDRDVILAFESTGQTRTIASTTGAGRNLAVGQANGNWVAFERWSYRRNRLVSCDVFLHDVGANTTSKIPNPNGKCQYAPSVDPAGTVYFVRSGYGCGLNVSIRAYPVGGPATTLTTPADGRDVYSTYALDNGDSTTDVFYDPFRCTRRGFGPGDIYKVTTPAP